MKDLTQADIRKDGSGSKPWCLHFSDGRKECFASRDGAEKREKQVKMFKHMDKSDSSELAFLMSRAGILAEVRSDGSNESIFLVEQGGAPVPYMARATSGGIEVFPLNHEEQAKYAPMIEAAIERARSVAATVGSLQLSEVVIGSQLIVGSHTHTVELDENGIGQTSDDSGHTHYVEYGNGYVYISSAPVDVAGIQVMHSHLISVSPKVGV